MFVDRKRLSENMKRNNIPVMIVAKVENAIYLTSFFPMGSRTIKNRYTYVVYFADEKIEPIVLTPRVDLVHIRELTWINKDNIFPYTEFITGNDAGFIIDKIGFIADVLTQKGLDKGVVGIELVALSEELISKFRKALPKAQFVECNDLLRKTRMIKTSKEQQFLREACRATQEGCLKIIECAKEGMYEDDAASHGRAASMLAGGETIGFCAVGSGPRSAIVHNNARHEKIMPGTVLRFDYGALYNGYWGDLARSYVVNAKATKEQAYLHEYVLSAQEAALAALKPGVTAAYVYDAAIEVGRKYDKNIRRELVGHSLGLEIHEEPVLRKGNELVIEPGMVICVEVGKYEPEIGGFQIEDTVIVGEKGIEIISSLPKTVEIWK